jgi:hypothetical protein
LFASALFFPIASAVCGALGDGANKIEESYGTLVRRHLRDDGAVEIVYRKDRYLYRVTFESAVSVAEEYSRVDGANLSEKEIARFLKSNAGPKMTWTRANATRLERSDHRAAGTVSGASLKVHLLRAKPRAEKE